MSEKARLPGYLPTAIRAGKHEAWGRMTELTPKRMRLMTAWDWEAGPEAEVEFELNGQTYRVKVRALAAQTDADGYRTVDAGVLSLSDVERLAAALLPLLSP